MHTNIRRIVALCCDDKKIEKHKRQQEKKLGVRVLGLMNARLKPKKKKGPN